MEYKHISDCWKVIEDCNTHEELFNAIDTFPNWSGDWEILDNKGYCQVINFWYDKSTDTDTEDIEDTNIAFDEEVGELL